MNRCFEEIKKSKYLTLVPINESQEKIKKYQKMWGKIRNLIRSVTKNSDDYDYELPLNKTIEIPRMKTVVRAVFYENKKLYPQVFLDECLYKLWIILKFYIFVEFMFLKELMLIRQAIQKSLTFVTIGNF